MKTIDKLAWIHIHDRKVLFARSKGKDAFYLPGGKREATETDQQALIREVKEEMNVSLDPKTISYLETFSAPAHGQSDETIVEIKCYAADFEGDLQPTSEIAELAWLTSDGANKTSATGVLALQWLEKKDLIN